LCRRPRHTPHRKPSELKHPIGATTREPVQTLAGRSFSLQGQARPKLLSLRRKNREFGMAGVAFYFYFYFFAFSCGVVPWSAPA
jgi:hypothetical protein